MSSGKKGLVISETISPRRRLAGDERACLGVGEVVEVGYCFPDAGGKYGVDGGYVIDGAGDGGDRDSCERGYATDVDFGRGGCIGRFARTFHGSNHLNVYDQDTLQEQDGGGVGKVD